MHKPFGAQTKFRIVAATALHAVLVAALLGWVLTGCSSSGGQKVSPGPKASSAKSSPVALQQNSLPRELPTNEPAARAAVQQTKCAAIPGGWGAAGTVHNASKKAMTYRILVYFTTTHATTLDYSATMVRVPAGKTAAWRAQKKFAAQAKMLCPMPSISTS